MLIAKRESVPSLRSYATLPEVWVEQIALHVPGLQQPSSRPATLAYHRSPERFHFCAPVKPMQLIDPRDQGAKALRAYEMQRDVRYPTPFEKLSGDAKETSRRAFDRLSAEMALEGMEIRLKE